MWNLGEYCTTSEAILTATNKTGCSLIPGTVFCEVLEANRPGMIIDKVMKNLGNYTSVFVVVVVVVGNYSDVDRNFNKSKKRFGDSGEVSPWNKKGAQNLFDFILFFFTPAVDGLLSDRLSMRAKSRGIFVSLKEEIWHDRWQNSRLTANEFF